MKKNKKQSVVRTHLSVTEIAAAMGVSRQMADRYLRQGRIPASIIRSRGGVRKVRDTLELRRWLAAPKEIRRCSIPPKSKAAEAFARVKRLKKSLATANEAARQAVRRAGEAARQMGLEMESFCEMLPRDVCLERLKELEILPDDLRRMRALPPPPSPLTLRYATHALLACGAVHKKKKDGEKIHEEPTLVEMFINFHMDWNEFLYGVEKLYPREEWRDEDIVKIARQLKPMSELRNRIISESSEKP